MQSTPHNNHDQGANLVPETFILLNNRKREVFNRTKRVAYEARELGYQRDVRCKLSPRCKCLHYKSRATQTKLHTYLHMCVQACTCVHKQITHTHVRTSMYACTQANCTHIHTFTDSKSCRGLDKSCTYPFLRVADVSYYEIQKDQAVRHAFPLRRRAVASPEKISDLSMHVRFQAHLLEEWPERLTDKKWQMIEDQLVLANLTITFEDAVSLLSELPPCWQSGCMMKMKVMALWSSSSSLFHLLSSGLYQPFAEMYAAVISRFHASSPLFHSLIPGILHLWIAHVLNYVGNA